MALPIHWCTSCLNASTRPRISFDSDGVCNACQWALRKKDLDWEIRAAELRSILLQEKDKNLPFDCIVPVSGGKDGSYVAHRLKSEFGLNPLTVTVRPPGASNRKN